MKQPTRADLVSLATFMFLLPAALILRLRHPDLWLVSERPGEARDNAHWFFRYIHEHKLHPRTYYVIQNDSVDTGRIRNIAADRILSFGSLKHYLFYIASSVHISAHVGGGMPNARVSRHLERAKLLRNRKVFIQHGITKDTLVWLFRRHAGIDLFCCASQREAEHILDRFGYRQDQVALTGLCRYDQLEVDSRSNGDRTILVLPTWRKYLAGLDDAEFRASRYFRAWSKLLNCPELAELLHSKDCRLVFRLHPNLQRYAHLFSSSSEHVTISGADSDIQSLLKQASFLVTDFSSVFFDFAYMDRPLAYYQFDESEFRSGHWAEGYFNYEQHGFGPVIRSQGELLDVLRGGG